MTTTTATATTAMQTTTGGATTAAATAWPVLKGDHPIILLYRKLSEILKASEGYNEIWGIRLVAAAEESAAETATATEGSSEEAASTPPEVLQPEFHTALILQKFLRANANDLDKAYSQLKDTMVWRRGFFGPGGEMEKGWDEEKFRGLGYITTLPPSHGRDTEKVISWNVYGAAKDVKATFGDLKEFIRWRVALMEESLVMLSLGEAKRAIPDYGGGTTDVYQMLQVHDYKNVSFMRLPTEVRQASRGTIEVFARYYPETLERKYFVNVPAVMAWVYGFMKRVLSSETMKKLEMLGGGTSLAAVLGDGVSKEYGGKGEETLEAAGRVVRSPKKAGEEKVDEKESGKKDEVKEEAAAVAEPVKEGKEELKEEPPATIVIDTESKPKGVPATKETSSESKDDGPTVTDMSKEPDEEANNENPEETITGTADTSPTVKDTVPTTAGPVQETDTATTEVVVRDDAPAAAMKPEEKKEVA